ncbi:hypothetical protein GGD81_003667 [Rhodobium orientis]|uniref:Uncharacterized protein n=1 Tax=Rhodobium orientis TaxID=34017 RepID=A0A327JPB8_9HYPH|nr:hypothetical protein [Rhodobium orientis]MBB4304607.1 hypothetical protein [Rhodobium orientis]MBK5951359.1 hypothetical protein [Rhodobium orientis]RAI27565.1 hypothetical protein CH339_10030 [Rhodobium orientis]
MDPTNAKTHHARRLDGADLAAAMRLRRVITLNTICPHTGTVCRPGLNLIAQLDAARAFGGAGSGAGSGFAFDGCAIVEDCGRSCRLGFSVSAVRSYVFGDIERSADLGDLIAGAESIGETGSARVVSETVPVN